MVPIHLIGIFYAIFYLKEVKKSDNDDDATAKEAYDNPAMADSINMTNLQSTQQLDEERRVTKNACVEFFDPQLAIKCIKSFIKERENGLRTIIILFMLMHFVCNGISLGESQNLFLYVRAKLNWDVDTYVYHNVFTSAIGLIGTAFAVGLLSKILKVSDITLILCSTFLSIVCRGIYKFASTTLIFFLGTAFDFVFSVKFLAARSIISKIVPSDDISTMFAIMGLFEAIAGFVFPYIYPTYYQHLLAEGNVSNIYVFSAALFTLTFVVYA
jgi:PCFT/HCP family folate transporter-like MFS transporter 1/3